MLRTKLLILNNINVWHIEFLLLMAIFFYVFYWFKKSLKTEEYTVLNHLLTTIVTVYKNKIYLPSYEKLINKHDLDRDSQTNSSKLFIKQVNELLSKSCNDIIKNYLPKQILTKLYKYYSMDSIVMTILSILED